MIDINDMIKRDKGKINIVKERLNTIIGLSSYFLVSV